jgi:hypothetical protein
VAAGAAVAFLISRRVLRRTRGLAFWDMTAMRAERKAMLRGIR